MSRAEMVTASQEKTRCVRGRFESYRWQVARFPVQCGRRKALGSITRGELLGSTTQHLCLGSVDPAKSASTKTPKTHQTSALFFNT